MVQHFLYFSDIASDEIQPLLERAIELKSGASSSALAGKSIALLFEKPSLRTKLSFWVGSEKLGGKPVYFSPEEVGLGKREPVADVAQVMSRMSDMAIIRTLEVLKTHGGDVLLVSHDNDFRPAFASLIDGNRRLGVLGFTEYLSGEYLELKGEGKVELFDLEDDARAFEGGPLPRIRVIPIGDFDPLRFL